MANELPRATVVAPRPQSGYPVATAKPAGFAPPKRILKEAIVLYVDLPTRSDFESLVARREPACVSIYLPTTPLTQEAQADRIALGNLAREAQEQLRAAGHRPAPVQAIAEQLDDLIGDDAFWAVQARSLAIFATPVSLLTFRLANRLTASVEVADRFHVKPLLRAVLADHEAFVLALARAPRVSSRSAPTCRPRRCGCRICLAT